jgi:hypothetical protein
VITIHSSGGFRLLAFARVPLPYLPCIFPPLFPTLLRTTGAGFSYNIGRITAAFGTVFFGLFSNVGRLPVSAVLCRPAVPSGNCHGGFSTPAARLRSPETRDAFADSAKCFREPGRQGCQPNLR